MTNTCAECSRPNCNDTSCTNCIKFCWQLEPPTATLQSIVLWPTALPRSVDCLGSWQNINNEAFSYPYNRADLDLGSEMVWLQLIVLYSDGSSYSSYFDSFDNNDYNELSVGNYIGGDAGNFWKAPFSNRIIVTNVTTNCLAFYYVSPDNCTANGIESYLNQVANNVTLIYRGYEWQTCNSANFTNTTYVVNFKFFMSNDMNLLNDTIANNTLVLC